jgi:hypothetical protein
MPKKKKGSITIDPFEDMTMLRIFNDLSDYPVVKYEPEKHGNTWPVISKKIGVKCKKIIDNKLLYPTSYSRYYRENYITLPKGVEVKIKPYGKKKIVLFNRKIF